MELKQGGNNLVTELSGTTFGINAHFRVNKIKVSSYINENPMTTITSWKVAQEIPKSS